MAVMEADSGATYGKKRPAISGLKKGIEIVNTQEISAGFEAAVLPAVILLLTMFRDDPAAQRALQEELETARERIVEAGGSELRLEAFDATAISLLSAMSGKAQPASSHCIH